MKLTRRELLLDSVAVAGSLFFNKLLTRVAAFASSKQVSGSEFVFDGYGLTFGANFAASERILDNGAGTFKVYIPAVFGGKNDDTDK